MSRGYICSKGRDAPEQHYGAARLRSAMQRGVDGIHRPLPTRMAISQIAREIGHLIEHSGPEALAIYVGTQANLNPLTPIFAFAFAKAVGTDRIFGTMTIDQSSKWITDGRLGMWRGGIQPFDEADCWMLVGANPLVSMSAAGGSRIFLFNDPVRKLKAAKARGLKLIIMDPRLSDIARHADVHLRPRPGQDVPVLAALCRTVLEMGWHDKAFLERHAQGVPQLRAALEPFTPQAAGAAAGIDPELIVSTARLFAHDSQSGMCGSGTGLGMARRSNLAEHLVGLLNVLAGRYPRGGERSLRTPVLQNAAGMEASVGGPGREWEHGPRSAVHGLGKIRGQAMTATLTDEILDAGDRRIRSLLCIGGNPAVALPGHARAYDALSSLDLLVTVDPRMSATARLADYILAPVLPFERADHTGAIEGFFREPYANYAEPLIAPPEGVIDDWLVFWELARHLGLDLEFLGEPLDFEKEPTRAQLLERLAAGGRISLATVRAQRGGRLFPADNRIAVPDDAEGGSQNRFALLPTDVANELAAAADDLHKGPETGFRLIVRRLRQVMNSAGTDFESVRKVWSHNPAFLHPADLEMLGLCEGRLVKLTAGGNAITCIAAADSALQPGTVSVSHCWSGDACAPNQSTSALVDVTHEIETINRMPVMTGMVVKISPAP
jgi:anaerobic selenocysteine-containing dehydrogenase